MIREPAPGSIPAPRAPGAPPSPGLPPPELPRHAPATVAEAGAILREAAARGEPVAFEGGGTDLELGAPGSAPCSIVETTRLARVIEYAPADQVVVAEAGLTLAALQQVLAKEGQRLALDPPLPGRATLGGILSANAFGPLRTRYGAPRDVVIGIAVLRADGALVRGGGKVVKNVAGFDLPRLFAGALGTLGLVAELSFRLHPLPETSATLLVTGLDAAGVWGLARALRESQLEPAALAAVRDGRLGPAALAEPSDARLEPSVQAPTRADRPFEVGIRFEGFEAGVSAQARRALELAGKSALLPPRGERPPAASATLLDPPAASAFWERHDALRRHGSLRVKLAALPSAFEAVAEGPFATFQGAVANGATVWYPTLGLGFAGGEPLAHAAAAMARARAELSRLGGALTVCAAPPPLRATLDPWGAPPPALALMRRLKERLDPDRRLAPGRFVGGI